MSAVMRERRSTTPNHAHFNAFLNELLQDVETRAAYEDSQNRHLVVDMLVRLRNRLKMTQTDVARKMGVKQPSISGFENEGSDPRLSTLQRYARAVDATLWVQVQPNAVAGLRAEFYVPLTEKNHEVAYHRDATRRSHAWADTERKPYRHLRSVPIPAHESVAS